MEKRNKKKQNDKKDKIEEIFYDEKQITETLRRAVREAVEIHKRAGNPLATWKNGRLVLIKSNSLN